MEWKKSSSWFLFVFITGLITLDELHQRVLKGRGKYAQDVSQ